MESLDDRAEQARKRLGTILKDKYRLDAVLGIGGMATVYRATHRNRARFAIKVLHPELSVRADVRARFLREGYVANSVEHAGVVRIVDDDVAEDGSAFLVIELLEGATVEELWQEAGRRMLVQPALSVLDQLLDVLSAAHDAGVIHRDIKPANLFVMRDGSVRVLDFGIARVLEGTGTALSTKGVPIGTPTFMAPEQALARSSEVDGRTDLWAAAATFFTLVSGATVHDAPTPAATLVHAATDTARSLAEVAPDVPSLVAGVVDRALAFDRTMRWSTASAMRDAVAEACRVGFGATPSKATLAALVPGGNPPARAIATVDMENAPTMEDAVAGAVGGPPTTGPISRTRVPEAQAPRSSRRPLLGWVAVAVAVVVGAGVTAWRQRTPPRATAVAVSTTASSRVSPAGPRIVLILDIENRTANPLLDGTVGAMLAMELERSRVMYPYSGHRARIALEEEGLAPGRLDEAACRALAEHTGRPVTSVRGAVSTSGHQYVLEVAATDAWNGRELASLKPAASSGSALAEIVASLAGDLRAAMGDPPEGRPNVPTFSTSLQANRELWLAREGNEAGDYGNSVLHATAAVEIESSFSLAQYSLGILLFNEGRPSEAVGHLDQALAHQDQLPERERLRVEGMRAGMVEDFATITSAYEKLLAGWPEDLSAQVDLSGAFEETGDFARALDVGRRAAARHPRSWIARENVIEFELDAGEFEHARRDADQVIGDFPTSNGDVFDLLGAACALSGDHECTIGAIGKVTTANPSLGATDAADLAMFEGRLSDAVAALEAGIAADDAGKRTEEALLKWALLADARARARGPAAGVDAALHASASHEPSTLFLAGHVLAEAGRGVELAKVARAIRGDGSPRPLRLASFLDADLARVRGLRRESLEKTSKLRTGRDRWLACTDDARAHLDLGQFEEAEKELATCWANRGAMAHMLLEEKVLLSVLPPIRYYMARAKEGLRRADAADAYREFLAMEPAAQGDPLEQDARQRLTALERARRR